MLYSHKETCHTTPQKAKVIVLSTSNVASMQIESAGAKLPLKRSQSTQAAKRVVSAATQHNQVLISDSTQTDLRQVH